MNFTGQTVKNQKLAEKERIKALLLEAKKEEKRRENARKKAGKK